MTPNDVSLQTKLVLLRPMQENDLEAFGLLTMNDDCWGYFSLNLANPVQLKQWVETALRERDNGTRLPFTIIDKASGGIAGSMSMGNISVHDRRLEIGWSWLSAPYRSTGFNLHSKYAMLEHAFERMRFERVEFKTDVLNTRARKGLKKLGASEEGILRSHMTMWNNRRRDSIYYSILKAEWPVLKQTIFKDIAE
ncbi:MAG TPA: GNAT family protein [Flavisolibacter sp.]|nr:GNAT family protein [Flavisolibacter sp.]